MSQGDLGISNKDETHFSSEKAEKGFKVAIVVGGMIGLVCAVVLAQAGVDVEVYEATVRLITRRSNSQKAMMLTSIICGVFLLLSFRTDIRRRSTDLLVVELDLVCKTYV